MQSNSAHMGPADLLVVLDRTNPRQLRAQLERSLRDGIQSGRLSSGTTLPSSRALASDIGVARSVVVDAYEQLIADGYLEARQGAGTRIRQRRPTTDDALDLPDRARGVGGRNMSGLPDLASFPRREWLRHYRSAVNDAPDSAFDYPDSQGVEELRRALASYLGRVRSTHANPSDIVICSGFSHGLALLSRALRSRGATRLAVEEPCFSLHRRVIRSAGLEPVPVPVDQHGIDVDQLVRLQVDGVLLSPAHSYPTGAVLAPTRRVRLVDWAREVGALIIEDDYDAEFRYDRKPIGSLQGLAPGQVVYGGTASKMLSPALRLGWLIVPSDLISDVMMAKQTDDVATEGLGQLALARLIESGDLSRHLRRVRSGYRIRRNRLISVLKHVMPEAEPVGAEAGLHLYLKLPPETDENGLVTRAQALGLPVEGSQPHLADPAGARPAVLIGYGALRGDSIEHIAISLAELAHAQARRGPLRLADD